MGNGSLAKPTFVGLPTSSMFPRKCFYECGSARCGPDLQLTQDHIAQGRTDG